MHLGTRIIRQSPRLQNHGVEEGECSRRTRSMKKKGRALSQVQLNFGKRPQSSVKFCEAIGSKSDSNSDFDSMNGKCKDEVVDYKKHTELEVDASIQLGSRFLKMRVQFINQAWRNKEVCGYESDIEHPGRYVGNAFVIFL